MEASPGEMATTFEQHPIFSLCVPDIWPQLWLGETLIQNIDLLRRIGRRQRPGSLLSRERSSGRSSPECTRALRAVDLALSLARFRKREYVRILLRDVLGIAKLAETTEEISALADALIEEALLAMTRAAAAPARLSQLG